MLCCLARNLWGYLRNVPSGVPDQAKREIILNLSSPSRRYFCVNYFFVRELVKSFENWGSVAGSDPSALYVSWVCVGADT